MNFLKDKKIREKLEEQKKLFRKLMSELNGKEMDYETCRMLEDFFNEYHEQMLEQIEMALRSIVDNYNLIPKKRHQRRKRRK